jgi:hypothetical protein
MAFSTAVNNDNSKVTSQDHSNNSFLATKWMSEKVSYSSYVLLINGSIIFSLVQHVEQSGCPHNNIIILCPRHTIMASENFISIKLQKKKSVHIY